MKRTARLTSALLARKGFAAPAHVQTAPHIHYPFSDAADASADISPVLQMPSPAPVKRTRPFGRRQEEPAPLRTHRAAMTLRLDEERHLRLRVFSAHTKQSSQEVLTKALDEYLKRHSNSPEMRCCDCLQSADGKH